MTGFTQSILWRANGLTAVCSNSASSIATRKFPLNGNFPKDIQNPYFARKLRLRRLDGLGQATIVVEGFNGQRKLSETFSISGGEEREGSALFDSVTDAYVQGAPFFNGYRIDLGFVGAGITPAIFVQPSMTGRVAITVQSSEDVRLNAYQSLVAPDGVREIPAQRIMSVDNTHIAYEEPFVSGKYIHFSIVDEPAADIYLTTYQAC